MKIYLVGGAVRDKLLGKTPKDLDYIVIGSNHDQMLKKKFLSVGKSHSVYLHPVSKEQYTLADSLEEDLMRRDLTINGMALEGEHLMDPFGGRKDLEQKILRHIQEENFYSDPLRVYRVARFYSQFPDFSLHPLTQILLEKVVLTKNFTSLARERIFFELKKSFLSSRPSRFFHLLKNINALNVHFPEINDLQTEQMDQTMKLLNATKKIENDGILGFLSLGIHLKREQASKLSKRLLVPFDWARGIKLVAHFYQEVCSVQSLPKTHLVDIFYSLDSFRQEKFIFYICELLKLNDHFEEASYLQLTLALVRSIGVSDINKGLSGKEVGEAIRAKRIQLLESFSF